jgi:hypothetical protein
MGKERAHLSFDDDFDVSEFQPAKKEGQGEVDKKTIEKVAEESGFISRVNKTRRRKRPQSPFKNQLNLKCRDNKQELFQDIGDYLDVRDHTTFERAILALLEKEGATDLLQKYRDITK